MHCDVLVSWCWRTFSASRSICISSSTGSWPSPSAGSQSMSASSPAMCFSLSRCDLGRVHGNAAIGIRPAPTEASRDRTLNGLTLSSTRITVKKTGTCPKCESRDLIRIPGSTYAFGAGNNVPAGTTIYAHVPVARFLCSHCGYSEEWIESPADIEKLRKKYAGSGGAG